jgi:hypothetical protein
LLYRFWGIFQSSKSMIIWGSMLKCSTLPYPRANGIARCTVGFFFIGLKLCLSMAHTTQVLGKQGNSE